MGALLFIALLLSKPAPFVIANGSGVVFDQIDVRPADGSGSWKPLRAAPLSPSARAEVQPPAGEDCGFDLQAKAGSVSMTWPNVNLCDVKVVTLNRRADGTLWVDYD